jgi:hypothetical protein
MPDIKTLREAIYKTLEGHPGPCPKCGGTLENTYQSYMVLTRTGDRMEDSFMIGGDFGWFCQSCPIVVLNKTELDKMMRFSKPGWKVGQEFTVAGILDLEAVPANKRHLPIGAPGNPVPLVKFRASNSEAPTSRQRHRKK